VEVDDNAHVLIDFGESVFAVVTTGFTMQQCRSPAIELYGSGDTIQIFKETDPYWPWTDGLKHIVECIQQNVRPIITSKHAYHVLEIMLMAQESSRDGQAGPMETTFMPPVFADERVSTPVHLIHDPNR